MEKLSPEGKSSLLSSLSKLLGKKKELQDLELTVRTQGNGRRCRGTWRWGSWWGIPQTRQKMASGQRGRQWMPSPRLVKCPPPRLPGSPLHLVSLWRWANSADSQVPPDRQRVGSRPAEPSFGRGLDLSFPESETKGPRNPRV